MIDDVAIARAIHVLTVVLWIGGVGLVTTALRLLGRLHWGALGLALLTILGAVAGSHGLLLFEP